MTAATIITTIAIVFALTITVAITIMFTIAIIITTKQAVIYDDDAITISTFPLKHRVPAVGFLFREKPKLRHINSDMVKFHNIPLHALNGLRQGLDYTAPDGTVIANSVLTTPADASISYAYCSDTAFSPRVIEAVTGTDWIYHEATYDNTLAPLARSRYHSTAATATTARATTATTTAFLIVAFFFSSIILCFFLFLHLVPCGLAS